MGMQIEMWIMINVNLYKEKYIHAIILKYLHDSSNHSPSPRVKLQILQTNANYIQYLKKTTRNELYKEHLFILIHTYTL